MRQLHIQRIHEHERAQLRGRTRAGGAYAEFAVIRLDVSQKLFSVFGWEILAGDQHHRPFSGAANRLEIINRVIRKILDHHLIGGMADVDHQQCVAVRFGARNFGRANAAGSTSRVVDHNLLAEYLLHGSRKDSGNDVPRPASGVRHDHGDRAGRKVLREAAAHQCQ